MNFANIIDPRCLRCGKRGSGHVRRGLPFVPEYPHPHRPDWVVYVSHFASSCHQGGEYLPRALDDDELAFWVKLASP